MKKVLEFSAKVTIWAMIGLAVLGLVLFGIDTQGDVLGSIADWDDTAQQTAIWVGLTLGIALLVKLLPRSYRYVDEKGNTIPDYK